MKKRIWLPLVFLCLVAFAGIALADTKQSSMNGMKVESSYNLEKDGSAAYASLWTSQNVYSWSISVTAYAVDPLTGEVRKTARTEKGEDGNGTAFAVRAAGGEFLYQVNYRDEVQTVDQDGRPAGKLTCNDKTVWKWTMPEKVPTPTVAPTAALIHRTHGNDDSVRRAQHRRPRFRADDQIFIIQFSADVSLRP